MSKLHGVSVDRLSTHFVNYLFDEFRGSRHVRRVASWVGLILLGIQRIGGQDWEISRKRQLQFAYGGTLFKARYNHKAGHRPGGGIEIVEVRPGRGSPDGQIVSVITDLEKAEEFYNRAPLIFKKFAKLASASKSGRQ